MKKIKKKSFKQIFLLRIALLIGFTVLVYVCSVFYLYINQDSMIFHPMPLDHSVTSALATNRTVQPINMSTSDGYQLKGWLVNAETNHKKPLVIYYGGNAEEVSDMVDTASQMPSIAWALVNYRGYGDSTGVPTEEHLFADALYVYDALRSRQDIDPSKIALFGRSLGGGVAVYVAQHRQVNRLLLVTPYDSVTSVAQDAYPYFPVSLLLKYKFDSLSRAGDIHVPVLILAAENDKTIPVAHASRLAKAFDKNATYTVIPNTGHISIGRSEKYLQSIVPFLDAM